MREVTLSVAIGKKGDGEGPSHGVLPLTRAAAGRRNDFANIHGLWRSLWGFLIGFNEPSRSLRAASFFIQSNRLRDKNSQIGGSLYCALVLNTKIGFGRRVGSLKYSDIISAGTKLISSHVDPFK